MSQDLPSYVPTDGLVAYYPFNGNANDESGNTYHGTVNGATLSSDRYGNENSSYSFDGVDDYIVLFENGEINFDATDSFSYSLWFKQGASTENSYGNINGTILASKNNSRNGTNITVGYSNKTVNFFIEGDQNLNNSVASSSIPNHWVYLSFVYDSSSQTLKAFNNGSKVDELITESLVGNLLYNSMWIGRRTNYTPLNTYVVGSIDDIGIWNRALTEQEIQNLYNSSTADILLNGTVSAENNQIKNVADPTEAQDAVTMAYLQTKLDELTNRVKYLEDTAPNKPSGTWTKVFDLENLPENFDFTSMQKVTQYSHNKSNKEVYFLNRNKNSLLVYDIDMNTFNEINVDYQISSGGAYIYNPQKNTIEYLRAGRETVYEIDLSSYGSSLVKSSGSDTSHYGANMFYNPFTSEIGQIFGYGWFRVKNSMANLNLENGWVVSIADSDGSPQRRTGAQVFPTKDYKKIIVLGGYGNQSGSQTEDSCSNPNTIPWASDVGVWCFQSDIWEIDLADYSATQISDFNIGMKKSSVMSYNYDKNIIINYAGILPPATYSSSYSQEVANWDFSLLFFDMNNPNLGWQEQSQSGDLPSETLEKGYFIYDENSSLFYYFRNDGVWTLSM
jgi:hypothetical protein